MNYSARFDAFQFRRPSDHVILASFNRPDKLNALTNEMHEQFVELLRCIDADNEIRVSIFTGNGRGFCAGADVSCINSIDGRSPSLREFSASFRMGTGLVSSMLNSRKPIISAINGPAAGSGAAIALLADISIAAESARIIDAHTLLGVTAGDHAAIVWPLLCGMAKAKYLLLTSDEISGQDAEKCNLVAECVADDVLLERALEIATRLSNLAPTAVRMTKHVLNHWIRQAAPIFELSVCLEIAGFNSDEMQESLRARQDSSCPSFNDSSF